MITRNIIFGIVGFHPNLFSDFLNQDEEEVRRAELEACERRKLELTAAASFHMTPDATELQLENKARNHHVIERAQELKDEQLPEVIL